MTQGRGVRGGLALMIRVVLVAALVVAVFVDPVASDPPYEPTSIPRFAADFDLAADGTLVLRETIDVDFPDSGRRGIFRIYDIADPRRAGVRHPVSGVSVTRDGSPEPWKWWKTTDKTKTIRIGDENVYLDPGRHRYVINSVTKHALEPGDGDRAVWWWDVIGSGWQMPITAAVIRARMPVEPERVQCVQGKDTPCTAEVDGRTLTVRTGPLRPYTPVTVKATFPPGALPKPSSGSLLREWWLALLFGGLGLGLGYSLVSRTREPEPGFPVLFEPPGHVSPAVAAHVLYEQSSKQALQATLYSLADRGVLTLAGDDDEWVITLQQNPELVTPPLDGAERPLLLRLGLSVPGDTFKIKDSKSVGEKLSDAKDSLETESGSLAGEYLDTTRSGIAVKAFGALSVIVPLVLVFQHVTNGKSLMWPLLAFTAAFAIVAAGALLDPGSDTKRNALGRELWSRTGGFARFLTTDSSESRFNAAEHMDWFPRYLPWAVAFGAADRWAERYTAQNVTPPDVPWLIWSGSGDANRGIASMSDSFDSVISSAVSTYEASQSSSGGGGFSGGSGGGGGGGGSW